MTSTSTTAATTELAPSYRIPLVLIGVALLLGVLEFWLTGSTSQEVARPWLQLGLTGLVGLFGVFLLVQALTLRLRFTDTALDIYRGSTLIRHFPYAEWQHWEIFWPPVPILFYFREINSIHFLPILFSPTQLRTCLEAHCPNLISAP
ncbi:MAG: DUF3119 family protein [Leptolyngbyaceae cyanobacterium SM2_5_2]|nr:DUF3119 family protein [Leptolyngbyaceae cyanobacterium SM2_5_2]